MQLEEDGSFRGADVCLTSYGDGSKVYTPAEDSFLFVDALLQQRPFLRQRFASRPEKVFRP